MTKKSLIYSIFMILSLLLGSSFFPVFFSAHPGFSTSAMLVLAWVFIDGFEKSLVWIIVLGVLADFSAGFAVGMHIVTFVSIAYFASFLSGRFLVHMRGVGIIWVIFLVCMSTLIIFLLVGVGYGVEINHINKLFKYFNEKVFFVSCLANLVMFFLWYGLIKWINKHHLLNA